MKYLVIIFIIFFTLFKLNNPIKCQDLPTCQDNPDDEGYYDICECKHWIYYSCFTMAEIKTDDPITNGCIYWPYDNTYGKHIAKFKNQLSNDYPMDDRNSRSYSANEAQQLMDECRGNWQAACDPYLPGLIWEESNEGCVFMWTSDPKVFQGLADLGYGFCDVSVNNDDLQIIKAVGVCNPGGYKKPSDLLYKTKIVFNNTSNFFDANPLLRWTTENVRGVNNPCIGTDFICVDFKAIALHEMGHYVGLGHQGGTTEVVMFQGKYEEQYKSGKTPRDLHLCDIASFRNTYCCDAYLDVNYEGNNFDNIKIELYPNPSDNIIIIKLFITETDKLFIGLIDNDGKVINIFANQVFEDGNKEIKLNTDEYYSGSYFIKITNGKKYYIKKLIINH